jgi:hypothetical protein
MYGNRMKKQLHTAIKKLTGLSKRTKLIAGLAALVIVGAGSFGGVQAYQANNAKTAQLQSAQTESANTKQPKTNKPADKPAETKPAEQPKPATADANKPAAAPAAKTPTTAKPKAAAAPANNYPYGIAPLSPNALRFIIPAQQARPAPGFIETYHFDFSVERDGTYTGPSGGLVPKGLSGPSGPGEVFCGRSIGGTNTATIELNPTAQNGTYVCTVGSDIGYTRFLSRFTFVLTDEGLTITGSEVLPGAQFAPGQ